MRKLDIVVQSIILTLLVIVLVACQSIEPMMTMDCLPTSPELEWYETEDGGIYYTERSVTNLMFYIEDMKRCIDSLQKNLQQQVSH